MSFGVFVWLHPTRRFCISRVMFTFGRNNLMYWFFKVPQKTIPAVNGNFTCLQLYRCQDIVYCSKASGTYNSSTEFLKVRPSPASLCVCVFSSHSFRTSSSMDVPAGVIQEEGHTGFFSSTFQRCVPSHFFARRIQPFLYPRRP